MSPRALTWTFILVVLVQIAAYDIWVLLRHGKQATISGVIGEAGERSVLVPVGVLLGQGYLWWHWFG